MSSTAIVRALLAANAQITAITPATNSDKTNHIWVGVVPQEATLPAIGVSEISNTEDITTSRRLSHGLIRSRVQVTVYAKTYQQMKDLLRLAKLGGGVHTGVVTYGGKSHIVRSVLQWGVGPEIPPGDDKIYEQSRDFMVTFMEAN